MNEITFYEIALVGVFAVAGVTAPVLLFITAPYGRHLRRGWGPTISITTGWILMESFAVGTIAVFFFIGDRTCDLTAIVFLAMWQLHYVNRTFIYPLRRRGGNKQMPGTVSRPENTSDRSNDHDIEHHGPGRQTVHGISSSLLPVRTTL